VVGQLMLPVSAGRNWLPAGNRDGERGRW